MNLGSTATPAGPARAEPRGFSSWADRIYELSSGEGRVKSIEGLRGLAVLFVFCVHFDALFGQYAGHVPLLRESSRIAGIVGNIGVDLFFVISGYLIYGALLRQTYSPGEFLRRRIERIYPTFLAVFAVYLLLSVLFPEHSRLRNLTVGQSIPYIIQNLVLLPGVLNIRPIITVSWSLSYEWYFYTVAALLITSLRLKHWPAQARIYFFVLLMSVYLAFSFSVSWSLVRALMFIAGILVHEASASHAFRGILTARGELMAMALLLAGCVFSWLLEARRDLFSLLPGWWAGREATAGLPVYQGPYKTAVLIVCLFWFTAYCFSFDGLISRTLRWSPMRCLGNMSYSYYLVHGLTLQALSLLWIDLAGHGVPPTPLFCGALVAGPAAAWFSSTVLFLAVEKPCSIHKKNTLRRQKPHA